jgi:hypothetical protein
MDTAFITIVQKLISEKGKDVLLNAAKCKGTFAEGNKTKGGGK